jgi:hypothetical protein
MVRGAPGFALAGARRFVLSAPDTRAATSSRRSSRLADTLWASTSALKCSSNVASGGTSTAPGASGCRAADHVRSVSSEALAEETRPTRIESAGVLNSHLDGSFLASVRPSNVDSPGLSDSTSSSSGGHSPSGSNRTTLVVTQRTRPATGGVISKGVSSFGSGPAEKSLPRAITACEKVSVMASCPANSSLAEPDFPRFVGVKERSVNGWSTAAVSLAGRFPASAGAQTSFASIPRAPLAGVGDVPGRPVGSFPTLLRTEKRLREMRLAAKPSTRRSLLRAEHGMPAGVRLSARALEIVRAGACGRPERRACACTCPGDGASSVPSVRASEGGD